MTTIAVLLVASFVAWENWRLWHQKTVFVQFIVVLAVFWTGKRVLLRRPYRTRKIRR